MRKQLIISALLLAGLGVNAFAQQDDVLMNINGKDIKKSEFEYIFHKNNKQQVDAKGLEEYMPLFVNYKLKVDAAEKAGIDTTAAFVKELDGYKQELAKPYLVDRATEEALLQEAYAYFSKNVELSHVLISFGQIPNDSTRAAALARANEVVERARAGEDFAALAAEYSEDPGSKSRGGYLGYVKGGRLIYPFEKVAFTMAPGEISNPVETRFGYHVIKVHDARPDRGDRLCAHIFLMMPREANAQVEAQKKAEAEAIYNDIMAGADFEQMAREKSEDQSNAMNGGKLPWCSAGDLVKEFEQVAFSLNVGEVSQPVRTNYGYHIIKVLDARPCRSFEAVRSELQQRMSRDERGSMARNVLLERLKKENNCVINHENMMKAATLCGGKMDSTAIAALAQNELVLATFGDKQYTTKDAAVSINPRRLSPATTPMQAISNDVERAVEMGLMNIEISTLEVKYPEYSNLINEYRDGMLLFEISNREVWEKASTDVKGLEKFFNKNKKNYKWDRPRYKGFVVYCANEEMVKDVKKLIKKTDVNQVVPTVQAAFNNDSVTNVVVERGLYLSGDNKYVDELAFEGAKAERDADLPVVFLSGKVLKAPETYLDVRGQVTADYQEYLEKQWVNKLNKNAKVVINQDVLKTVK